MEHTLAEFKFLMSQIKEAGSNLIGYYNFLEYLEEIKKNREINKQFDEGFVMMIVALYAEYPRLRMAVEDWKDKFEVKEEEKTWKE